MTGPSLPVVPRLAVFEESAGAGNPDAAWMLRGRTRNSRYTRRDEQEKLSARQAGLGRPEATRAALIPITKSHAWWALAQDERRELFELRPLDTGRVLSQCAAVHAATLELPGSVADEPGGDAGARTVRLRHGYLLHELRRPGALSASHRQEVLSGLEQLSAQAFGVDMRTYWEARAPAFFEQISYLAIMHAPDGEPVGWTSCRAAKLASGCFLYWDATGIIPQHQRHGLIPQVQGRVYRRAVLTKGRAPLWVVYRTRSPVVLRSLRNALGPSNVHPSLDAPVPQLVRAVAAEVAGWLGDMPAVDISTLVVRGAYAGLERLYSPEQEPRSKEPAVDDFMASRLGEHDGLLVLARVRPSALLRAVL